MTVDIQNVGSGGGGSGWTWYTLGKNNDREHALLIDGNPKLGDAICESINYKSGTYTRFVVSFAKQDNVTPDLGREIVREFFDEFMRGFDRDEYHLDIVEHTDTDHLHYHARIPKLNLLTQTQLKPYYHKADLELKKAVIDHLAVKHNLTIGMDSKRQIKTQGYQIERINEWRAQHGQKPLDLSTKKSRVEAEERINDHILRMANDGLVSSLDDVVAVLERGGVKVVNRGHDRGKDFNYVTIQSGDKKLRLKGDVYGEEFYRRTEMQRQDSIAENISINATESVHRRVEKTAAELKTAQKRREKWIEKQYGKARKRARERIAVPASVAEPPEPAAIKKEDIERTKKDDTAGAEAIRRTRELREETSRRVREIEELSENIRREFREGHERASHELQKEFDRYTETRGKDRRKRERAIAGLLEADERKAGPDYSLAARQTYERSLWRAVRAALSDFFREAGEGLQRLERSITRRSNGIVEVVGSWVNAQEEKIAAKKRQEEIEKQKEIERQREIQEQMRSRNIIRPGM